MALKSAQKLDRILRINNPISAPRKYLSDLICLHVFQQISKLQGAEKDIIGWWDVRGRYLGIETPNYSETLEGSFKVLEEFPHWTISKRGDLFKVEIENHKLESQHFTGMDLPEAVCRTALRFYLPK
jgi:hypothetical protein